jgi:hypothetical protein
MWKKIFFALVLVAGMIAGQRCEYEKLRGPVDCEENPVTLKLVATTDADCALMDGTIKLTASGGEPPYVFVVEGREPQPDSLFENLAAGVYQVSAVDVNNCSATLEVTLKNANGLNLSFETGTAGCGGTNGRLTVTAVDGTPPYQFKLGNDNFSAVNSFDGLSPGDYTVTSKDASGCVVSQKIRVKSGISYSATISGIIENNCAVYGCHSGSQFPDFRVFKNIHDNAAEIKKLTADGTMPQEGTLTQEQINQIACWVDDGASNN